MKKALLKHWYKPSLFQHVGLHSSLPGKLQHLKASVHLPTVSYEESAFSQRVNVLQPSDTDTSSCCPFSFVSKEILDFFFFFLLFAFTSKSQLWNKELFPQFLHHACLIDLYVFLNITVTSLNYCEFFSPCAPPYHLSLIHWTTPHWIHLILLD